MLSESTIGTRKMVIGAMGNIDLWIKLVSIGSMFVTTIMVIIKMMNPIKSEPESPINTFLFLLKLKGRYAKIIPMSSKHNPK
tara:strand:+ start:233 stop:478 length:246 start_codon:yes stop_codon:yes gene_type:complete